MRRASLALVAAALVGGCGSGDGGADSGTGLRPLGEVRAGSVAPLADCRDWRAGTPQERLRAIDDIRSQVGLQDTPTPIPELSDDQAYDVFQRACSREFAGGFRLYKIYARAVAFESFSEE